jgi:hypothetical protein
MPGRNHKPQGLQQSRVASRMSRVTVQVTNLAGERFWGQDSQLPLKSRSLLTSISLDWI